MLLLCESKWKLWNFTAFSSRWACRHWICTISADCGELLPCSVHSASPQLHVWQPRRRPTEHILLLLTKFHNLFGVLTCSYVVLAFTNTALPKHRCCWLSPGHSVYAGMNEILHSFIESDPPSQSIQHGRSGAPFEARPSLHAELAKTHVSMLSTLNCIRNWKSTNELSATVMCVSCPDFIHNFIPPPLGILIYLVL